MTVMTPNVNRVQRPRRPQETYFSSTYVNGSRSLFDVEGTGRRLRESKLDMAERS
jgi:hypothetical protein